LPATQVKPASNAEAKGRLEGNVDANDVRNAANKIFRIG
jgi:hypothetical protein